MYTNVNFVIENQDAFKNSSKIAFVKAIRGVTRCSLKEAVDAFNGLMVSGNTYTISVYSFDPNSISGLDINELRNCGVVISENNESLKEEIRALLTRELLKENYYAVSILTNTLKSL